MSDGNFSHGRACQAAERIHWFCNYQQTPRVRSLQHKYCNRLNIIRPVKLYEHYLDTMKPSRMDCTATHYTLNSCCIHNRDMQRIKALSCPGYCVCWIFHSEQYSIIYMYMYTYHTCYVFDRLKQLLHTWLKTKTDQHWGDNGQTSLPPSTHLDFKSSERTSKNIYILQPPSSRIITTTTWCASETGQHKSCKMWTSTGFGLASKGTLATPDTSEGRYDPSHQILSKITKVAYGIIIIVVTVKTHHARDR